MELTGTVLNVVDFGVFVDIGLKDSGLVHVSEISTEYVRSPHDVLTVGDVITVWVLSIDRERRRVALTMIPPGTPRPSRRETTRRPNRRASEEDNGQETKTQDNGRQTGGERNQRPPYPDDAESRIAKRRRRSDRSEDGRAES